MSKLRNYYSFQTNRTVPLNQLNTLKPWLKNWKHWSYWSILLKRLCYLLSGGSCLRAFSKNCRTNPVILRQAIGALEREHLQPEDLGPIRRKFIDAVRGRAKLPLKLPEDLARLVVSQCCLITALVSITYWSWILWNWNFWKSPVIRIDWIDSGDDSESLLLSMSKYMKASSIEFVKSTVFFKTFFWHT